jgi:hypothetical protein
MNTQEEKAGYGNRGEKSRFPTFPPSVLLLTNQHKKAAEQNNR